MSIGSRIKEARIKCGYNQQQLAALIGVTKGAVGNYESDYSSPKTLFSYNKLNNKGKKEAVKRVNELSQISEYVITPKSNTGAAI